VDEGGVRVYKDKGRMRVGRERWGWTKAGR
jgi:hypothetical protein